MKRHERVSFLLTTAACFVGALALALLAGCATTEPPPQRTLADAVPILRHVTGNEPAFVTPQTLLIDSQSKLQALGASALAAMEVDFVKEALLVVSLGERPTGGYRVDVTGVRRLDRTLILQITARRPGPNEGVTLAATHPFAAAVIPAPEGAMHLMIESTSVEGSAAPGQP